MKYLLATSETIPSGVGFAHFDRCHILWLLLFAAFTGACCFFYRKQDQRTRCLMRRVMAAAILADELLKMAVLFIGGTYLPKYLPLHLCSINLFLIAWHAVKPNRTLDNFLYAICLPGALLALLFPSWTKLPPSSLMHIHSFTVHILLAAYPLMQLSGKDFRPDPREIPKCLLLLAFLAAIALCANLLFGTNFMFLMRASKGNPLYWFQTHMGSHLWGFPILIPPVLLVLYLPYRKKNKV